MNRLVHFCKQAAAVWRDSWQARRQMDGPPRLPHEIEFLPAAEALRDTPVHPAPRVLLVAILCLCGLTLAWGFLGRIDVVSAAEGKVLAVGRSKPIQPDNLSVVKAIHVHDGQRVRAGQLLVEFDPSLTETEVTQLRSQLLDAQMDLAQADALLLALRERRAPVLPRLADAPAPALARLHTRISTQYEEYRARLAQADSALAQRDAEVQATVAAIDSLKATTPISRQMADDYRGLLEGKFVSRHAWLEREQAAVQQKQQLVAQQARLGQAHAAQRQASDLRSSAAAELSRGLLDLQLQAGQRIASLTQELRKAQHRDRQTRLVAPVAGTVQQLAVSAPGAVVTAAQPVLLIVPNDQPVDIEAFIANRDVGFVHVGQAVRIKVDAFDFTRFGMLDGEVVSVSSDAIADAKRGAVYSVRVRLRRGPGQRPLPLAPGMSVRAEIHTGHRRLISYFLSPLQRRTSESLQER
ncbi:MAG TPA: HlyD family type I secretion periplasmic adaptor subunit [Stenotrophomonas sp.]|nr:HlyD family type I secretion periplasmic adaptor subunit [Stenotrophomonas sp.]